MAFTGVDGSFSINALLSGCVKDASVDHNREALEKTCLGEDARSFQAGVVGASGTANLVFEEAIKTELMAEINQGGGTASTVTMELNLGGGSKISGNVWITSVGTSVSVGDLVSTSVAFTFEGKPTIT